MPFYDETQEPREHQENQENQENQEHQEHQDWLREQQMQRGICSESTCHWPIAGWCTGCRAKLCQDHLHEHRNLHARPVVHATLQQGEK